MGTLSNFTHSVKEIVKSMGLVFGDIGTSPIYTISIIFLWTPVTKANVLGVLSLIFWTLILLVMVMYVNMAMNLGKKGEGGTIVLKEILTPLLKSGRQVALVTFLAYIGISFLFGDGVITPAISILSAVEGCRYIPALQNLSQSTLIMIAAVIAVGLFSIQRRGTDRIARAFGPLMVLWFGTLAISGFAALIKSPFLLQAINPWFAMKFMVTNGFHAFFVLSEVILCATGGEALYADMGHLGRKPIVQASYIVLIALIFTYFGQGAFLLSNPGAKNVLFEMVNSQVSFLYIPFLLLSVCATVIASQAMISGIFSIVYQGITTNIMPPFKVDYTSSKFRSQIYVGFINWFLLLAVLLIMFKFKASHNLAAAYGFAVTGTMVITAIMMSSIFYLKKQYYKFATSIVLLVLSVIYFFSNMLKIPHGGYWSIIIALFPLLIILLYTQGKKKVEQALKPMALEKFLEKYREIVKQITPIKGSALFFSKDISTASPYIVQTMFKNNIIYEDNILISIVTRDDPFGVIGFFKGDLASGLRMFEIHMGYMEIIDIEKILSNAGINAKVIFHGLEEIRTKNPIWQAFAFIKQVTPSTVKFYNLSPYKLHGVVTLIDLK